MITKNLERRERKILLSIFLKHFNILLNFLYVHRSGHYSIIAKASGMAKCVLLLTLSMSTVGHGVEFMQMTVNAEHL